MQTNLIYRPGKSILHRANPFTKLAAIACLISLAFILPWWGNWLTTLLLFAFAVVSHIGGVVLRRYIVLFLPFIVAIFVFHGLIHDRPDFRPATWMLSYSPTGLKHAALAGGRISAMLAASLLFVASTSSQALLRSFDAARFPPGLSYLLASPLLMVDQFAAYAKAIGDAQRVRGLDTDGSIANRIRALRVLIVPLLTLALADAHERSGSLTARGFRALPYRTVVDPPRDSAFQRRLRIALLGAAVLLPLGYFAWR